MCRHSCAAMNIYMFPMKNAHSATWKYVTRNTRDFRLCLSTPVCLPHRSLIRLVRSSGGCCRWCRLSYWLHYSRWSDSPVRRKSAERPPPTLQVALNSPNQLSPPSPYPRQFAITWRVSILATRSRDSWDFSLPRLLTDALDLGKMTD